MFPPRALTPPALFAAFVAMGALTQSAPAQAVGTVTFHIADETDPSEITEATTVFINGQLVAHFELNANHPYGDKEVILPAAERYEYALCGRITIRAADGHSETHVLDDGATLGDPSGKHLEALASDGFTTFYLAERVGNTAQAPTDIHKTNVCSIPVS